MGCQVRETPRDQAFCAHALETPDEVLVVEDSHEDPRFAGNPLVTGPPYIRFYAGMPLRAPSGHVLGTVCIIDQVPRPLDARQEQLLRHAARQVEVLIAEAIERRQLTERQAELVETNQELEQSIAERSQFLAVAKHKLKTPLAVIAGWSSTLQAFDSLAEKDRADGLAAIERAAGELRAQIDDLLDEARIHMVGQTMKLEHLVLVEFVDAVLAELKVDPATHPVSVAIEPGIVVHAHREGLRHIIAHLVDNAVKYSPDGGAIRLSAQPGDAGPVPDRRRRHRPARRRPALRALPSRIQRDEDRSRHRARPAHRAPAQLEHARRRERRRSPRPRCCLRGHASRMTWAAVWVS